MSTRTTGARHSRSVRAVAAVIVTVLLVGLSACSSGGESSGGSDSGSASDMEGYNGLTSDSVKEAPAADGAGRVGVQTRAVISTGRVDLESADLVEARSQVERLLGRFGGYVGREETASDDDGRTSRSTLQLRVPSQHFDTVMGSFAELGKVLSTKRESEDVTTEVIDVDSRIRTQEVSLGRLRKFLARATKVTDMIRIESEIARREADLASLRAQQEFLADQTSLATITLTMALPPEKAEEDEDPLEDAGFLTGLRNGWDALTDVAVVGATAAGALLPFAVVLGLLLVPLVVWLRSGRRRRQPTASAG